MGAEIFAHRAGHPWPCPLPAGWAGRFTDRTPLPYLPVEPWLIAEVETDAATDGPFERPRHGVTLVGSVASCWSRNLRERECGAVQARWREGPGLELMA